MAYTKAIIWPGLPYWVLNRSTAEGFSNPQHRVGFGFRGLSLGFGFWVLDFGFWVLGFGFWVWGLGSRFQALDPGFGIQIFEVQELILCFETL